MFSIYNVKDKIGGDDYDYDNNSAKRGSDIKLSVKRGSEIELSVEDNSKNNSKKNKKKQSASRFVSESTDSPFLLPLVTSFLDFRDVMKLCVLNKALNIAMTTNETIWFDLQHVNTTILARRGVTISFLDCLPKHRAASCILYKIVLNIHKRIRTGLDSFSARQFSAMPDLTNPKISFREFDNLCSALENILRDKYNDKDPVLLIPSVLWNSKENNHVACCIFCGGSVGGTLLPLLGNDKSIMSNIFPIFHDSQHVFSLECNTCPFRVEASVMSKSRSCEICELFNGGAEINEDVNDIFLCDSLYCAKSCCNSCRFPCEVEGCHNIVCDCCSKVCGRCSNRLCFDHSHNKYCERCDETFCRVCASVTWLTTPIYHEKYNRYSICSICTPDS